MIYDQLDIIGACVCVSKMKGIYLIKVYQSDHFNGTYDNYNMNGVAYSRLTSQRCVGWEMIREYPHKIWPTIWYIMYITVPPWIGSGNSHWDLAYPIFRHNQVVQFCPVCPYPLMVDWGSWWMGRQPTIFSTQNLAETCRDNMFRMRCFFGGANQEMDRNG